MNAQQREATHRADWGGGEPQADKAASTVAIGTSGAPETDGAFPPRRWRPSGAKLPTEAVQAPVRGGDGRVGGSWERITMPMQRSVCLSDAAAAHHDDTLGPHRRGSTIRGVWPGLRIADHEPVPLIDAFILGHFSVFAWHA